MEFQEIVAITGMSGLFRVLSSKSNGVIVTGLEDGKSQFISARVHNISSLENITIYLDNDENRELKFVFADMLKAETATPLPDAKASNDELRKYFTVVIPTHDKVRVHNSDIKKMVRWFHILKANNLIKTEEELKLAEEKIEKPAE
ncbi:hypothetical protein LBMAG27_14560 [Bacteroidota bacterium]|nr:hypothetical protein LBMAG27_14560 [Bacteroidota bacterium]